MDIANDLRRTIVEDHDLSFIEDTQYVYHCHHYNLFHDQTIDDALGPQLGAQVRQTAARRAFAKLLGDATSSLSPQTEVERIQLSTALFAWMGHGKLSIDTHAANAVGSYLHYGTTWHEKYGDRIRRLQPADGVAAGFLAALLGGGNGSSSGWTATETECVALRNELCRFQFEPSAERDTLVAGGRQEVVDHAQPTFGGRDEDFVLETASKLRGFVAGVGGDERGLIAAFGIYITMHLSNYYNETAFEMIRHIEEHHPERLPLAIGLMREAGHVCVFNTFGNILFSPEWEGLIGLLSDTSQGFISSACAIARALGFGRWAVADFVEGERLVLRTPMNYEAPFWLARYGASETPRCYFFQGSALALAVLAHELDWRSRPILNEELYISLFRSGSLPWKVTQTKCPTVGDAFAEAVVERR